MDGRGGCCCDGYGEDVDDAVPANRASASFGGGVGAGELLTPALFGEGSKDLCNAWIDGCCIIAEGPPNKSLTSPTDLFLDDNGADVVLVFPAVVGVFIDEDSAFDDGSTGGKSLLMLLILVLEPVFVVAAKGKLEMAAFRLRCKGSCVGGDCCCWDERNVSGVLANNEAAVGIFSAA